MQNVKAPARRYVSLLLVSALIWVMPGAGSYQALAAVLADGNRPGKRMPARVGAPRRLLSGDGPTRKLDLSQWSGPENFSSLPGLNGPQRPTDIAPTLAEPLATGASNDTSAATGSRPAPILATLQAAVDLPAGQAGAQRRGAIERNSPRLFDGGASRGPAGVVFAQPRPGFRDRSLPLSGSGAKRPITQGLAAAPIRAGLKRYGEVSASSALFLVLTSKWVLPAVQHLLGTAAYPVLGAVGWGWVWAERAAFVWLTIHQGAAAFFSAAALWALVHTFLEFNTGLIRSLRNPDHPFHRALTSFSAHWAVFSCYWFFPAFRARTAFAIHLISDAFRILRGYGFMSRRLHAVGRLYRSYYGHAMPRKVRQELAPFLLTGRLTPAAVMRVMQILEESLVRKLSMSPQLARVMGSFLSLVCEAVRDPITMTLRNRFKKLLDLIQNKKFQKPYPVFAPDYRRPDGKKPLALNIGTGFPAYGTGEWAEAWHGRTVAMDKSKPNRVMTLKGLDPATRLPVTLYVLLDERNGHLKYVNMTVDCSSERVLVTLQNELMSRRDEIIGAFLEMAAELSRRPVSNGANRTNWDGDDYLHNPAPLARWAGVFQSRRGAQKKAVFTLTAAGLMADPLEVLRAKYGIPVIEGDAFDLTRVLAAKRNEIFEPGSDARLDVITIFNVLIYFPEWMQKRFLDQAAEALNEGGVLITGMASPTGSEFIYTFYVKKGGRLIKTETMMSPTNLIRPLWEIRPGGEDGEKIGKDTADQNTIARAVLAPLRAAQKQDIERAFAEINTLRNRLNGLEEFLRPMAGWRGGVLRALLGPAMRLLTRRLKERREYWRHKLVAQKLEELRAASLRAVNPANLNDASERGRQLRIAIHRYIRSVPYQSISGDSDEDGWLQILAGWGGTCISKTYLEGLLFEAAGHPVDYSGILFDWTEQPHFLELDRFPYLQSPQWNPDGNGHARLRLLNGVSYVHFFLRVWILDGQGKPRPTIVDDTWDRPFVETLLGPDRDARIDPLHIPHPPVRAGGPASPIEHAYAAQGLLPLARAFAIGLRKTDWNGRAGEDMPIGVQPVEGADTWSFRRERPVGRHQGAAAGTNGLDKMLGSLEALNSSYYSNSPHSEEARLLLRDLSDIGWWMRAPELVKNARLDDGAELAINEIGAISLRHK